MHFQKPALFFLAIAGTAAFGAATAVPGINNFYQVNQQVYRGAQPTSEGIRYIGKLGVKVVLDLRGHDSRSVSEERLVRAAGMRYINVPMTGFTPPTQAEIAKILALLEDPAAGPVFVHCRRGADRTGAVIAAYRIDHDKWDNARALQEAMSDGMSWLEFPRQKYIQNFHSPAGTVVAGDAAGATSKN
jgi:protein tyrosine phosphatase (PTP) superfamily phosphohydrolase (DUF442 family)